jgi:hypothetical protein
MRDGHSSQEEGHLFMTTASESGEDDATGMVVLEHDLGSRPEEAMLQVESQRAREDAGAQVVGEAVKSIDLVLVEGDPKAPNGPLVFAFDRGSEVDFSG